MDELGPPVNNVRFPAMRQEVVGALAALADRDYQQRVWIEHEYPRENFYDDLTLNINILYDMVLPDPHSRLGTVLLDECEANLLEELEKHLKPLIDELHNASDQRYVTDPRWDGVTDAAASALSIITGHRK